MCLCEEYWLISFDKYHDENGEPTGSLQYLVYCDHMGSTKQVITEIPLGYTRRELLTMTIKERIEMLSKYVNLSKRKLQKLASQGVLDVKRYLCPLCHPEVSEDE